MIKIRLNEGNEYYPDDFFMYDTFDKQKEGEYWYRTTHGVGPGSIPKGTEVYKTVDTPWGVTYFLTPNVLSTKALKDYGIREERPSDELLAKYDSDPDNRYNKYKDDIRSWVKGARPLER